MKPRRSQRPELSPTAVRDSQDVGMKVTGTTVWYRGQSATFSPQEISEGAGDAWIAAQKKRE